MTASNTLLKTGSLIGSAGRARSKMLVVHLLLLAVLSPVVVAIAQEDKPGGANAEKDLVFWEELAFWEAVKDSADPNELEAYLSTYPDGRFTALARVRLERLRIDDEQPSAPTEPELAPTQPDSAEPTEPASLVKSSRYVVRTNSNIRAAPTTDSVRIGSIAKDETIEVIGEAADGAWYRVKLADGRIGFIYASLLQQSPAGHDPVATDGGGDLVVGDVFQDCETCPAMVVIASGSFEMGSDQRSDEQPIHTVTLPRQFAIGVFEVTLGEWQACREDGGCEYDPGADVEDRNPQLPVSNISWDDARNYIGWLSNKTGRDYRLPSESEWEYAARGGSTSAYWWGDDAANGRANCRDCRSRWDNKQASPVGSFGANPFGLYDSHGNVWEWVADCWNGSYAGAPADTAAREDGDCLARVLRGGAWKLEASYMRNARRSKYDRDVRYFLNGFRLARDLP